MDWPLIAALFLPTVGGFVGALAMMGHVKRHDGRAFYQVIKKPSWTPPNWVFAPVWLFLYLSMGYASYMVYRDGGSDGGKMPLALYGVHLAFNWTWQIVFFRFHRIGLGLIHIAILDMLAAATAASFAHVSASTAYFMVPYLCWLGYATALNFAIWRLNSPNEGDKKDDAYKKHEKFRYIT